MTMKYLLSDDSMWEAINRDYGGPFPGVYRLHVLGEGSDFRSLPRLLEKDAEGIVYIGAAADVLFRATNLRISVCAAYRQVNPKTYADLEYSNVNARQAGKKIVRIPRFIEHFPLDRLCVTVQRYMGDQEALAADDPGHYNLEEQLLLAYEVRYGEKPALNG